MRLRQSFNAIWNVGTEAERPVAAGHRRSEGLDVLVFFVGGHQLRNDVRPPHLRSLAVLDFENRDRRASHRWTRSNRHDACICLVSRLRRMSNRGNGLPVFGVGVRTKGPIIVYSVALYGSKNVKKNLAELSGTADKKKAKILR